MAKMTKLVFDIQGKEYVLAYEDAKELYQELKKIFGTVLDDNYAPNVTKNDSISSFISEQKGGIKLCNNKTDYTITYGSMMPNGEVAPLNLHNIKGYDGVSGATMDDTITLPHSSQTYDWAAAPPPSYSMKY